MLTARWTIPRGYGRIVRDGDGECARSSRKRMPAQPSGGSAKSIPARWRRRPRCSQRWVATLDDDNAQREFYLTDIVALAVADGVPVAAHGRDADETLGVNERRNWRQSNGSSSGARADALMTQGATLADPARIDMRGTLTRGRDVDIDVGCVFEGEVTLADGLASARIA